MQVWAIYFFLIKVSVSFQENYAPVKAICSRPKMSPRKKVYRKSTGDEIAVYVPRKSFQADKIATPNHRSMDQQTTSYAPRMSFETDSAKVTTHSIFVK